MKKYNILYVDDDLDMKNLVTSYVEDEVVNISFCDDPLLGLEKIKKESYEIIILDRAMPKMDGIALLREIKKIDRYRNVPVIMLTASRKEEHFAEGIDAGVFYYLLKPFKKKTFLSVLHHAIREYEGSLETNFSVDEFLFGFKNVKEYKASFKTYDECKKMSYFLSLFFDEPSKALDGIFEIILNSLEHGNLDVGFEAKKKLLEENTWEAELISRQSLPEHSYKSVDVFLIQLKNRVELIIKDQGKGFEWQKYMELEPSRSDSICGRGIAKASKLYFDKVEFLGVGNEVKLIKFLKKKT